MSAVVFGLFVAVIVFFVLNFVIGSPSKSTKLDRQRSEEEVLLDSIPPTNYPHDAQKGFLSIKNSNDPGIMDEIAKEGSLSKFVHKLHTKFAIVMRIIDLKQIWINNQSSSSREQTCSLFIRS